jgi:hypothetical protein
MNSPTIRKTREMLPLLQRFPPTRRLIYWTTLIYALVYLWAIGDVSFHGWRPDISVLWAHGPLEILFKQRNLFYFEGIAIVNLGLATYLFSPVNLFMGLLLGWLVGLNLAFTFLAIRHSKAYQGRSAFNLLASLPALLAGVTCSAPVILVLLGIQASAAVLAFFSVLVPIALLMLLSALLFNVARSNEEVLQRLAMSGQ